MSDPKVTSSSSGPARVPDRSEPLVKKSGVQETRNEGKGKEPSVTRLVESDVLEISGPARQVAKLREEIAKIPDVRSERIANIREKIQAGTYSVPSGEVVRKIIEWGRRHGGQSSGG
jgi:negative regulator of flagellin synthesis FlgM